MALADGTLNALPKLAAAVKAAVAEPCRTPYLREVLTFELLLGSGKIAGGGAVVRSVKASRDKLQAILGAAPRRVPVTGPRFVRLNGTCCYTPDALNSLPSGSYIAACLPDVAVCPGGNWIVENELITSGFAALQDASSCLPPLAADSLRGATVLEVCSAPGSKTLHLLDRMCESGTLVTCEKDPKRAVTLIKRVAALPGVEGPLRLESGGRQWPGEDWQAVLAKYRTGSLWFSRFAQPGQTGVSIRVIVGDFLALKREDVSELTGGIDFLVVDPSCSGSGLPTHKASSVSRQRVDSLAAFQLQILIHCLAKFPAKRVCYSTCSLFYEENEAVAAAAVREVKGWRLRKPLSWWNLSPRVKAVYTPESEWEASVVAQCVRADPDVHGCRGFFLACLEPSA